MVKLAESGHSLACGLYDRPRRLPHCMIVSVACVVLYLCTMTSLVVLCLAIATPMSRHFVTPCIRPLCPRLNGHNARHWSSILGTVLA